MAYAERIQVLNESEIKELYDPPHFSLEERRYYFNLNDQESKVLKSIRKRSHRCYFVALLGYFKSKPVVLNPSFKQIRQDLLFIADVLYPGEHLARFVPDQKLRDRLYQKIFDLLNYKRWHERSEESDVSVGLHR